MQNAAAALQELRRHRQRTDARETHRRRLASAASLWVSVGGLFWALLPALLVSHAASFVIRPKHRYEPGTDPSSASPGEASVGATP